MKKYCRKVICTVLSVILLSGCTINLNKDDNGNITKSNITDTTMQADTTEEYGDTTTNPVADPVVRISDLSTQKVIWGPGRIQNHQRPNDPVSLQETFGEYDAYWLTNDKKAVVLTFDEGYENGFTPSILDTLKEKKINAFFFVTYDFARDNPELIRRMIDEGHIVGNHSYHHYSMDELDEESSREEVSVLHDYIKDNFNYTMSYFRFPKGEFSNQSLGILQDMGYKSVFWSFAYEDWNEDSQADAADALQQICNSSHNGEIMLLHAVSETNAEILGAVIDDFVQQGYKFITEI